MKHAPKFLGEGQYGCIHRPSLLCDPSVTMDYQNKVSKLLHKRHAEKELKEYELVQQSDKSFKYHLGTPETCAVGKVRTNMKPIGRCAAHSTILDNINHYSLLVMKNGGVDFIQFADKMKKEMSLKDNTIDIYTKLQYYIYNIYTLEDLTSILVWDASRWVSTNLCMDTLNTLTTMIKYIGMNDLLLYDGT